VPDQTATAARSYLYVPGDQPARLQRAAERGDTVGEDYRDQERFAARTAAFTTLTASSGPSLGPVTASLASATGQAVDQ
jgi:hypothetical protein